MSNFQEDKNLISVVFKLFIIVHKNCFMQKQISIMKFNNIKKYKNKQINNISQVNQFQNFRK